MSVLYFESNASDELMHYGILGMKWGVRRYQNKDGTYTAAGRKRYGSKDGSYADAERKKNAKTVKYKVVKDEPKSNGSDAKSNRTVKGAIGIANNTKLVIKEMSNINKTVSNLTKKDEKKSDLSNMSNADLEAAIKRMDLEKRYASLTAESVSSGKNYVDSILNVIGSVAGIGASVAGTIAIVRSLSK